LVKKIALEEHFLDPATEPYWHPTMVDVAPPKVAQLYDCFTDFGDRRLKMMDDAGIARAVLADPAILILDEATSSVDTRTEMHIQEALLRLMEGRTAFVIAHRLSTIRQADQVLVVNDHRIIERGNHQSLLDQGGFYHDLYMSQFRRVDSVVQGEIAIA